MAKIANKQVICDVLIEEGKKDKDIIALCSDSRGSASFTAFANELPQQFVETGIAEQNLVSISAGLAKCGKKPYAASPACFLSTRSYEQCKVDVAYSNTNVKLIGISGGVSYGALGMSHHSAQDIAAMAAVPNMRVYLPSDRFQTEKLMRELLKDEKPAYIRVGRNAVDDVYEEGKVPFEMDKATVIQEGTDVALIACGEMVKPCVEAAEILKEKGISAAVLDMYCVKPLDEAAVIKAAQNAKAVITVEEHAPYGGLGSMVSQTVGANCPRKVINLALPDAPVITELTFRHNIANEGGYPGHHRLLKNVMGTWILQELLREYASEGTEINFEQAQALARKAQPFGFMMDPDAPAFFEPGRMRDKIRAESLRACGRAPESPGEFFRCVYEGLALRYRYALELLEEASGRSIAWINVMGGGSQDAFACQCTADAAGRTVLAGPADASAIGNLMVQMLAAGEFPDLAAIRKAVRHSFSIQEVLPC